MSAAVSQLNAALGTNLQFSNPSGTVLQVLNNGGSNTVNSLSATSTVTSLSSGSSQLPLFTDSNGAPITGVITADGSQTTGLAGLIEVNPAVVASPSSLVAYSSTAASGDPTRPDFLLNQMTQASLTFSPTTGIGTTTEPYSGTLSQYMSQLVSQQSQAANAASNVQQGQDAVVTALQQRFNDQSGVNIDTEMSNLIALQNAYGANARVMTTIQQMMTSLLQIGTNRWVDEYHRSRIDHRRERRGADRDDEPAQYAGPGAQHRAGGDDLFGSRLAGRPDAFAQCAACPPSTATTRRRAMSGRP